MSVVATNYSASSLVKELHALPHYDLKFQSVSSTFDPQNANYLQSLGQFALPFLIIVVLVVLYTYIRFCCYERKSETQPSPSSAGTIRCRIAFFVALTLTAIGLGIYGNQQVHVSIYSFKDDIDTANTTLLLATTTVNALRDELMGVYGILQSLPNGVGGLDVGSMKDVVGRSITQVSAIVSIGQRIDFTFMDSYIDHYELIRYALMLTFILLLAAMTIAMLIGSCCRSRKSLIWTSMILTFGILIAGTIAGAAFALSVASADFCYNPNGFISTYFASAASVYYATCDPYAVSPFASEFTAVNSYVNASAMYAASIDQQVPGLNLEGSVGVIQASIGVVEAEVSCAPVHNIYVHAVTNMCDHLLQAIFIIAVSQTALILFLIILVKYAEWGWKTFDDKCGYYIVEDFVPKQSDITRGESKRYDTYEL